MKKEQKAEFKRQKEKKVIETMIRLYCRKNHKEKLLCEVHCFKASMREEIRKIMRFSGPRMILYHPVLAVSHVILTAKEKRRTK